MYSLNDKQIDFILNDISARGVKTEDLQYNLLDHVCCIIENELKETGNFEQFYNQTINRFYKKELAEIEDETQLLLTFKHYYTMKKIMMISGFFSATLLLAGAYFKLMHWPGANVMMIIAFLCFSAFFLPLMFTLKLREKTEKRDKVVLILGLIISMYLVVGALFKLMHWPAAGFFVMTGIPSLLFIYLPIYIFNGIRNPNTKVNTIVTSILIVAGCGLLMVLPNKANVYNVRAKHNYIKNEEIALKKLQTIVAGDTVNKEVQAAYETLMNNANDLKNALSKASARVDYNFYVEHGDLDTPQGVNVDLFELPETKKYLSSLVNFEKISKSSVYLFQPNPGYDVVENLQPNREEQIINTLGSHPNMKDLYSTIINTQEQACLAMVR